MVKKAVTYIFFPFIVLQISDFYLVYRQLCINGHLSRREDKKADLLFAASKNMINGGTSLRNHLIFDFEFLVFRFYCNLLLNWILNSIRKLSNTLRKISSILLKPRVLMRVTN